MNAGFGYGRAMGPQMMGSDGIGVLGAHGIAFGIGLLIVAAIVTALVIWAIARKHSGHMTAVTQPTALPASDAALDIARGRLARGELDVEQYKAIADALGG